MVRKQNRRNPVVALFFLGYAALMLYLLFVRNRVGTQELPYWQQVQNNYNLDPFHTVRNYWDVLTRPEYYLEKWEVYSVYLFQAKTAAINILGNIAMFIPLGTFLPALWPKLQKAWKTLLAALLSILAVEIIQLFSLLGRCDIDDLLLNMAGIAVGYALWRLCRWILQKRK